MASGLSRRGVLLGAGGVVAGAMAAAGCGSTRGPAAAVRRRLKAGSMQWRTTVPGGVLFMAEAAGMLCVAAGGSLRGLSATDGRMSWRLSGRQGDYLDVRAVGGKVFIVSNTLAVAALDPATGRQRWRFAVPNPKGLPVLPLFAEDSTTVYATGLTAATGRPRFYVFAIDAFTGERRWAAYFPPTTPVGPLIAGDGVVCVLSGPHPVKLIALDAQTGVRRWTAPGPAVPLSGTIAGGVIFGSSASTASKSGVVALDAATGHVLWTTDVGGTLWGTANDAGIVYASTFDGPTADGVPGDLIAFAGRTGKTLWKRHFPEGAPTVLEPAGAVLYTGIDSGDVHALDSATGNVVWSYHTTEARKDQLAEVLPTPGTVYLANLKGAIYAVKA